MKLQVASLLIRCDNWICKPIVGSFISDIRGQYWPELTFTLSHLRRLSHICRPIWEESTLQTHHTHPTDVKYFNYNLLLEDKKMLQHQDKKMKLKLLQHQTQSNSCNSPNQGRQQCCLNQGNNASANIGMLLCSLKLYESGCETIQISEYSSHTSINVVMLFVQKTQQTHPNTSSLYY